MNMLFYEYISIANFEHILNVTIQFYQLIARHFQLQESMKT